MSSSLWPEASCRWEAAALAHASGTSVLCLGRTRGKLPTSASLVASWRAWEDSSGPCWLGVKEHGDYSGIGRKRVGGRLQVGAVRGSQCRGSCWALARRPCTIYTEIMTFAAASVQYVARWTHKTVPFP